MNSKKLITLLVLCLSVGLAACLLAAPQALQSPDASGTLQVLVNQAAGQALLGQAWLGVELADVTQAKVQELKLPGDYGAIVTHVVENSPAAHAGLKENDVILQFGGMRVWSAAQLKRWIEETPAGRNVTLRISRDGQKISLQATVERSNMLAMAMPRFRIPRINIPRGVFEFGPFGMRGRLGIEAQDLTPQLASYFGVTQGKGVLVAEVEAGSPAAKAGVKAGDCIVRVGSTEVSSVSDLRRALQKTSEGDHTATLAIVRNGHEESVHVVLESAWAPNPQQEAEDFTGSVRRQAQEID